jgi:hypothetical protein
MKSQLIFESLNEFVNPGVGGYSMDQLKRDYSEIIRKNFDPAKFTDSESLDFFSNVIAPAFHREEIQGYDDLYNNVMGEAHPIMEMYEEDDEEEINYYDSVLEELEGMMGENEYINLIRYSAGNLWDDCMKALYNDLSPEEAAEFILGDIE